MNKNEIAILVNSLTHNGAERVALNQYMLVSESSNDVITPSITTDSSGLVIPQSSVSNDIGS